jgi:hypothetical protein
MLEAKDTLDAPKPMLVDRENVPSVRSRTAIVRELVPMMIAHGRETALALIGLTEIGPTANAHPGGGWRVTVRTETGHLRHEDLVEGGHQGWEAEGSHQILEGIVLTVIGPHPLAVPRIDLLGGALERIVVTVPKNRGAEEGVLIRMNEHHVPHGQLAPGGPSVPPVES